MPFARRRFGRAESERSVSRDGHNREETIDVIEREHGCLCLHRFVDHSESLLLPADNLRKVVKAQRPGATRSHDDWTAIELALEEGTSGTGSSRRGIGLFGVAEEMAKPGRQLIIHSGIGLLLPSSGAVAEATRSSVRFPGTLVSASIPT